MDPYFVIILLLSAWPTLTISLKSASGWRSGVVFATFYPAIVVIVGGALTLLLLLLAPLGVFKLG